MSYGGHRVPDSERFLGYCENCAGPMYMVPHGWSQARQQPKRWCSRRCRNEGNRREHKAEAQR